MRQLRHLHMHTSLTHASDSATSHAHAPTFPSRFAHARFGVSGWGFGVGSWWRAPRMETWHATARTLPHAHSFIWRLQGFRVGFRGGVVMTCAPHGNVARHSKDTSTCTLLYLETWGFRGGVSGWGFGVGFRGRVSGFRGGVVMTCAPHGNVARHSKDTSTCTPLHLETSGFRGGVSGWPWTMPVAMECEINTQNKPGSPWRKLIAIHNFVASAFLH